jgi:hypothetical protein
MRLVDRDISRNSNPLGGNRAYVNKKQKKGKKKIEEEKTLISPDFFFNIDR